MICAFEIAPGLGWLLRMAVSREREELADADAALLTGSPAGLARALAVIEGMEDAPRLAAGPDAHLYLADPRPALAGWWARLLATHPPLSHRIATLAAIDSGITPGDIEQARARGAAYARTLVETSTASQTGRASGPDVPSPRAEAAGSHTEPAVQPARAHEPAATPMAVVDAYRVGADGATVHAGPDAGSDAVARLDPGALVTVLGTADGFIHIATAADILGYLPARTSLLPLTSIGGEAA
jgi:hypothetical protein